MTERKVARELLKIDAVGFIKGDPIKFKSGILSPVYVDNRKLPSYPESFVVVIEGFKELIKNKKLDFDIIAGIATGGISYGSVLGYVLKTPSVYVRKETKGYGKKKRTEGESVKGKKVLLIEDLVTTGGSSLSGAEALRNEGAIVEDCLVIVDYEFDESMKAFIDADIKLHPMVSFKTILEEAIVLNKCTEEQARSVDEWLSDPWEWTKKNEIT